MDVSPSRIVGCPGENVRFDSNYLQIIEEVFAGSASARAIK
jgi:hypothetical protein